MSRYVILLVIVFGVQLAHAKPHTNTSQNTAKNANGNANSVAVQDSVSQIENKADTERAPRDETFRTKQGEQNQVIANATWWIMIFGGLSFVAALIYASVSILQWRQTARFFDITERPSLGIEGEMEWGQDPTTEEGFVEVTIKNSGKSPAVHVLGGMGSGIQVPGKFVPLDHCPEPDTGESFGTKSRGVIAIGGTTYLTGKSLTGKEFKGVLTGKLQYFVWIRLTYLKNPRQKKPYIFESYSRYQADTGLFVVCDTHNEAT
jgi:hypothetical protein